MRRDRPPRPHRPRLWTTWTHRTHESIPRWYHAVMGKDRKYASLAALIAQTSPTVPRASTFACCALAHRRSLVRDALS